MKKLYISLWMMLAAAPLAAAQAANYFKDLNKVGTSLSLTYQEPQDTVANIVKVILGLVGIIFVILIIVAGIQWMTAGGNDQKVGEAKKRIVNATIGLTVTMLAYVIATWVVTILNDSTAGTGATSCSAPAGGCTGATPNWNSTTCACE